MPDWLDILLRLTAATLVGGAIGLNRNLHGKDTGLRTLAIIALGAASLVLSVHGLGGTPDLQATSRIVQGILTGIGFIGAGVIVRSKEGHRVHGLTTAASVWLTAGLGALCGLAAWGVVVPACLLLGLVLGFGGQLERAIEASLRPPGGNGERPPQA